MPDDRRATLEAIAFGDDPGVRPADRIRALELMSEATASEGALAATAAEVAALEDDLLAAELDALAAGDVLTLLRDEDERARRPATWAAIETAVRVLAGQLRIAPGREGLATREDEPEEAAPPESLNEAREAASAPLDAARDALDAPGVRPPELALPGIDADAFLESQRRAWGAGRRGRARRTGG
jgi:hypothetical protein